MTIQPIWRWHTWRPSGVACDITTRGQITIGWFQSGLICTSWRYFLYQYVLLVRLVIFALVVICFALLANCLYQVNFTMIIRCQNAPQTYMTIGPYWIPPLAQTIHSTGAFLKARQLTNKTSAEHQPCCFGLTMLLCHIPKEVLCYLDTHRATIPIGALPFHTAISDCNVHAAQNELNSV